MSTKTLLITSVLFGFLLSVAAGLCLADASAQLKQADGYKRAKQYEQAEAIYQQIVTDFPDSNDAFHAQKNLTILYVEWDRQPQAGATLQKLLADFPEHEAIAIAVTHVADTYHKLGKHVKAGEIYNYVVNSWPETEHGMWSQVGLVVSNTCLGNDNAAQTAFEKLCFEYSGHKLVSKAVCFVADNYRKLQRNEKAREHYQYVLANWPDAEGALWSQMGLAILNVRLGDYDATNAAVDKLRADFSRDERMATAACLIADEFRKLEKHEKAREHYLYVVNNWPDAEYVLWSQMGLVISNIRLGDYDVAQAATNKLRADFSRDERMATATCLIADEFRKLEKHEKAREHYQYVVNNWPEAEYVLWSGMGLAISNIRLGDYDVAQAAANKLCADFSDDGRMARAGCLIADEYRRIKKHAKACELYQYVVDNWPNTEFAMWSQMGLAISKNLLDNDNGAAIAAEKLHDNYSKQTNLPSAVFQIGESYYNQAFLKESEGPRVQAKDYFRKAITEWEKIIKELPESITTAQAYYFSGYCYARLNEFGKAIQYYQKVVDDWPKYELAWHAQLRIARCYNILATSGGISKKYAVPKIRQACQKLLNNYPKSEGVEEANELLEHWDSAGNSQ